jgi:tetratricopeptide (TPR) repeat protein
MGILHDYGFVEPHSLNIDVIESRGYSIHACLHFWTVHILNQGWDVCLSKLAMECIASRVPSQEDAQFWLFQRRLLAHAIKSCATIQDDCEGLEWAFDALGNLYSDQGKMQEAEEMYLRALRGKEKAWGPDHTSTLDTINNLGNLYSDQGKMQEAEEMYLRALRGYEKAIGPQYIARYRPAINTLWGFGSLLRKQGKSVEARTYYQRAYDNLTALLGSQHYDVQSMHEDLVDLNQNIHGKSIF